MKSGRAELNDFKGVRVVDCVGQFRQENLFVSVVGNIWIKNENISDKCKKKKIIWTLDELWDRDR